VAAWQFQAGKYAWLSFMNESSQIAPKNYQFYISKTNPGTHYEGFEKYLFLKKGMQFNTGFFKGLRHNRPP
jgi:hypothetical protein